MKTLTKKYYNELTLDELHHIYFYVEKGLQCTGDNDNLNLLEQLSDIIFLLEQRTKKD